MVVTFFLVMIACLRFSGQRNVHDAFHYIVSMLTCGKRICHAPLGMSTAMARYIAYWLLWSGYTVNANFGHEISYLPQAVRWANLLCIDRHRCVLRQRQRTGLQHSIYFQF